MPATIEITLTPKGPTHLGDECQPIALRLYAEGALFWPAHKTLFLADLHFGKADTFRHAGIAIPSTIIDHDLAKIDRLLADSGATKLIVLGDFFHTRHSQSDYVLSALSIWRQKHSHIAMTVVIGNHDLHAGPPPADLDIEAVDAPYPMGPFHCYHLPQPGEPEAGYFLAGHLHPFVVMRDRDGSSHRFASFIFGPDQAILPAFGAFTGGSAYAPTPKDRVFVIVQDEIIEVPTTNQRTATRRR